MHFFMSSTSDSNGNANHVCGHVAHGWETVQRAFEQNLTDGLDIGASLCVYYRGRCVVDLAGGWKDAERRNEAYSPGTLQLVFSTSKGVIAAAIAVCVERGWLQYDVPVAHCWPEFAQNGKQDITVGDLLGHRAGIPFVDEVLTIDDCFDWSRMVTLLAAQGPHWPPGSTHGYHAHTIGYTAGELIRRVDPRHRSYGQFVREELDSEFYVGVPSKDVEARVAPLIDKPVETTDCTSEYQTRMAMSCSGAFPLEKLTSICNEARLHRAQLPAVNGITNARSLARIYALLIGDIDDGGQQAKRLVSETTLREATRDITPAGEPDVNWYNLPTTFAKGGFQTYGDCFQILGNEVFGHSGYGGSCAFAFPPWQLAYAHVCNQMDPTALTIDPRSLRLIQAIEHVHKQQHHV